MLHLKIMFEILLLRFPQLENAAFLIEVDVELLVQRDYVLSDVVSFYGCVFLLFLLFMSCLLYFFLFCVASPWQILNLEKIVTSFSEPSCQ